MAQTMWWTAPNGGLQPLQYSDSSTQRMKAGSLMIRSQKLQLWTASGLHSITAQTSI